MSERALSSEPPSPAGPLQISGLDALRSARQALDDCLATSGSGLAPWGEDVLARLGSLEEAFKRHRDVSERAGGTLDQAVAARPGLVRAANRLRLEHGQILEDLVRFEEDISDALETGTLDREKVRWQLGSLQDAVRRHMGRGSDLLHEAFFHEDGGQG